GTATVAGHAPGSPAGLKRIGALIESPGFYPYLSGRENLRVVADMASVSQKRVDEVLASRAGRKFGTYSTGMKQRLGVAGDALLAPSVTKRLIEEFARRTHVAHLLDKLDLRDRVQAVILAYEAGLVGPG